jgi:hypothetical protein
MHEIGDRQVGKQKLPASRLAGREGIARASGMRTWGCEGCGEGGHMNEELYLLSEEGNTPHGVA